MTALANTRTLWPIRTIHMPAFFGALVLAPLLVTALSFYLFVPIFALAMGGPLYLVLGAPFLMWWLSRRPCDGGEIAMAALLINAAACALFMAYGALIGEEDLASVALLYLLFGSIFAPLWGGMFGWLYTKFTRKA